MKSKAKSQADSTSSAKNKALRHVRRLLAARDRSHNELFSRLEPIYGADVVREALAEARAQRWISSDEEISERLARALASRHKSRVFIEAEIKRRGLPLPDLSESSELAHIRHLLSKKFGETIDPIRATRFLASRGFTEDDIERALQAT